MSAAVASTESMQFASSNSQSVGMAGNAVGYLRKNAKNVAGKGSLLGDGLFTLNAAMFAPDPTTLAVSGAMIASRLPLALSDEKAQKKPLTLDDIGERPKTWVERLQRGASKAMSPVEHPIHTTAAISIVTGLIFMLIGSLDIASMMEVGEVVNHDTAQAMWGNEAAIWKMDETGALVNHYNDLDDYKSIQWVTKELTPSGVSGLMFLDMGSDQLQGAISRMVAEGTPAAFTTGVDNWKGLSALAGQDKGWELIKVADGTETVLKFADKAISATTQLAIGVMNILLGGLMVGARSMELFGDTPAERELWDKAEGKTQDEAATDSLTFASSNHQPVGMKTKKGGILKYIQDNPEAVAGGASFVGSLLMLGIGTLKTLAGQSDGLLYAIAGGIYTASFLVYTLFVRRDGPDQEVEQPEEQKPSSHAQRLRPERGEKQQGFAERIHDEGEVGPLRE